MKEESYGENGEWRNRKKATLETENREKGIGVEELGKDREVVN